MAALYRPQWADTELCSPASSPSAKIISTHLAFLFFKKRQGFTTVTMAGLKRSSGACWPPGLKEAPSSDLVPAGIEGFYHSAGLFPSLLLGLGRSLLWTSNYAGTLYPDLAGLEHKEPLTLTLNARIKESCALPCLASSSFGQDVTLKPKFKGHIFFKLFPTY